MSWVTIQSPPILCGRPPCPICYRWREDNGNEIPAIERMAFDLFGIVWRELAAEQKKQLEEFASKLHEQPIVVTTSDEPIEPARPGAHFEVRALELKLKGMIKPPPPKPRALSIDEIEDRKQAKKKKDAAKEKEKNKSPLEDLVAQVQKATKFIPPAPYVDPYESLKGTVPDEFIELGRRRGMIPAQVRYEFEKYQYGSSSRRNMDPYFDPNVYETKPKEWSR